MAPMSLKCLCSENRQKKRFRNPDVLQRAEIPHLSRVYQLRISRELCSDIFPKEIQTDKVRSAQDQSAHKNTGAGEFHGNNVQPSRF